MFTESEVDKRSKLYKAVQSKGYVAEFTVQDENTLKRWIQVDLFEIAGFDVFIDPLHDLILSGKIQFRFYYIPKRVYPISY